VWRGDTCPGGVGGGERGGLRVAEVAKSKAADLG